jgi:hypothetical protein
LIRYYTARRSRKEREGKREGEIKMNSFVSSFAAFVPSWLNFLCMLRGFWRIVVQMNTDHAIHPGGAVCPVDAAWDRIDFKFLSVFICVHLWFHE